MKNKKWLATIIGLNLLALGGGKIMNWQRIRNACLTLCVLVITCFMFTTQVLAADVLRQVVPLERAGVKLYLESFKQPGIQVTEPILLVHGLTYSSHEFNVDYGDYSLVRFLSDHGYEVWLLDIAGYGNSGPVKDGFKPNSDYAAEDIATAVKLILAKHNLKNMDVLGWSWGTVTSGRFAARYPGLVRKLVLYAPIVAGLAEIKVETPFNKNTWVHAAADFQTKADGTIDYAIVDKTVADTYLSNCWRYDKDSSPNGGRRDLLTSPQKRLIPTASIKAPVLIISGEKDQYVSPVLCREAFGTLTNKQSQIEIINGAAHAMLMEKPYYKAFRNKVLHFLQH